MTDDARERPPETDRRAYWTVPEIARNLRLSERYIWHKFLTPDETGRRLLAYYLFGSEVRIRENDYRKFLADCYQGFTPDDDPAV